MLISFNSFLLIILMTRIQRSSTSLPMSVKHIKSTNIVKGNLYRYNVTCRYGINKRKLEQFFWVFSKHFSTLCLFLYENQYIGPFFNALTFVLVFIAAVCFAKKKVFFRSVMVIFAQSESSLHITLSTLI